MRQTVLISKYFIHNVSIYSPKNDKAGAHFMYDGLFPVTSGSPTVFSLIEAPGLKTRVGGLLFSPIL